MKQPSRSRKILNEGILSLICLILSIGAASCFTGVEGTKKISLSREDRKALQPTPEEDFFKPVAGQPLSEWKPGRRFIAADNKTLLIFEQQGLPTYDSTVNFKGSILRFEGVEGRTGANGIQNAVILFKRDGQTYRYNTGKEMNIALAQIKSDEIPMMVDEEMVESAAHLLTGKKLWIRTPLWYDDNGTRVAGRKFIPVTITEVQPGTIAFPVKVKFKDNKGVEAWTFLNFGHSGTESRSFNNLFSLSDLHSRYPHIPQETWELICLGRVRNGMTKEECKLALGNPTEVDAGHDYSQTLDLWHYENGTVLWFEDGLLTRFRL